MPAPATVSTARLETQWARCEEDVRDAQRLRFRVFAQEMGARLAPPVGTPPGLDVDRFDPYCDHLLVRAVTALAGMPAGTLVGTYRVLTPRAAIRAGGFYTDTEFDLTPLAALRAQAVELGRSCVHPAWRSGGVIMALWSALGWYMASHGLDTMIGCASIGLADHGLAAGRLWRCLQGTHLVGKEWRVQPRIALPLCDHHQHDETALAEAPPLIKRLPALRRAGAGPAGP